MDLVVQRRASIQQLAKQLRIDMAIIEQHVVELADDTPTKKSTPDISLGRYGQRRESAYPARLFTGTRLRHSIVGITEKCSKTMA